MTDTVSPNGHVDVAVVGSARKLTLDDGRRLREQVANRQGWQEEAWDYFDEVPEVKFGINYLSNGMSKVKFYAATFDANGDIIAVDDEDSPMFGSPLAEAAVNEINRLRSESGGQGEINRLVTANIEVAGECYLHGIAERPSVGVRGQEGFDPGGSEQWNVRSVSEVEFVGRASNAKATIKTDPDATARPVDADTETLIRIYQRHPRYANRADSHVRGCMTDLEALVLLTNQVKADAKSRMNAGILLFPSELGLLTHQNATAAPPGAPVAESDERKPSPFQVALENALITPIGDPSAPESVVPLLVQGRSDLIGKDKFWHLDFGRNHDPGLDDRIGHRIDRVARGLNVPVEVVMGHMSTTFSNAEQIDQDVFDDHWEPRCLMVADAYTHGFLRPNLTDSYEPPFTATDVDRVFVWYDASALVRSASPEQSADAAWEDGLISDTTRRRLKGFTEDDAPDEQNWLRSLVAKKGQISASLTAELLRLAGVPISDAAVEQVAADEAPFGGQQAAALMSSSAVTVTHVEGNPYGRRLVDIDRELFARVRGAAEMAMQRALVAAGAKLRNQARAANSPLGSFRGVLDRVPAVETAATIGRRAVTAAGIDPDELLAGAWDDFGAEFRRWVDDAGEEALDVVSEVLGGMPVAQRRSLKLRMLTDADQAWRWLDDALGKAGKEALFAPERGAFIDELGETDLSTRVPPGTIREALAMAGGSTTATPLDKTPMGGVAKGRTLMGVLADEGAGPKGYRWIYGPARRTPFPPHKALNGVVFENFDDEVLTQHGGFPPVPFYYPGDHRGCVCDFEPIIIGKERVSARVAAPPKPVKRPAKKVAAKLPKPVEVKVPPIDERIVHAADVGQQTPNWSLARAKEREIELQGTPQAARIVGTIKRVETQITTVKGQFAGTDGVKRVREAATTIARDGRLAVNVSETNLRSVLRDGRFKSQFEVANSGGLYDPSHRSAVEDILQGVAPDIDPKHRPIYGFVDHPATGGRMSAQGYGGVTVYLRPEVRARTTMTYLDSLGPVIPQPIEKLATGVASDEDIIAAAGNYVATEMGMSGTVESYAEFQVHGGLTVTDFAEVVFRRPPMPESTAALDRAGVPWRVVDDRAWAVNEVD